MSYTKSQPAHPIVLTLSSSAGILEGDASSPVFSTMETNAATLGVLVLLLIGDS